jgi:hypothetical protein
MRFGNSIAIQRIANGYNVIVPSYENEENNFDVEKAKTPQKGNYIPIRENVFFKATLKDVFDFLTEIEKNPQPIDNYSFLESNALRSDIG